MKEIRHRVEGDNVSIKVAERVEDLDGFRDFVRKNMKVLAADSEATGVDTYAPGHKTRLWQFGNAYESWVIPVELGGQFVEDVRRTLLGVNELWWQNGSFDLQEADRHLGVPMEKLWPKSRDTKIVSHLVDPRGQEEGGYGHGLESLTRAYIDAKVADEVKGSMAALAKKHKTTKAKIWAKVDLFDPDYLLYAGMDPVLAARLAKKTLPLVPASSRPLLSFEHEVAEICSYLERTGFLLDVDYTKRLSAWLKEQEDKYKDVAATLGVENVNSTDQVAEAFLRRGVKLEKRTASGKLQVDKAVMKPLVAAGDELAIAITEAKKAGKWRSTWVDTFLSTADENGRCHASINSLRARTARMSITGIPAQTLPSSDWMIRRCFVADPGQVIASVDYAAQELRVLAALSGDRAMIQAFKDGADLHWMTARAAFGEDATVKHRKWAKVVNFGRVYGGGVKTVQEQTGLDKETAQAVVDGFDKAYPGVQRLSRRLQNEAKRNGYITTPSGRRLPVDPDRAYSALNYLVQSTSRDVTCRGLVKLHRAGFTPYLRLPIHDEVVASLPIDKAEWGAARIGDLMAEHMGPVHVKTDPEVPGKSWGHDYMRLKDDPDSHDLELQAEHDKQIKEAGLW